MNWHKRVACQGLQDMAEGTAEADAERDVSAAKQAWSALCCDEQACDRALRVDHMYESQELRPSFPSSAKLMCNITANES